MRVERVLQIRRRLDALTLAQNTASRRSPWTPPATGDESRAGTVSSRIFRFFSP
jgi:hypothetical protein